MNGLLIFYVFSVISWCFILIYQLNSYISSRRTPGWYRPEIGLFVFYGSILLSPLFVLFVVLLMVKSLLSKD